MATFGKWSRYRTRRQTCARCASQQCRADSVVLVGIVAGEALRSGYRRDVPAGITSEELPYLTAGLCGAEQVALHLGAAEPSQRVLLLKRSRRLPRSSSCCAQRRCSPPP